MTPEEAAAAAAASKAWYEANVGSTLGTPSISTTEAAATNQAYRENRLPVLPQYVAPVDQQGAYYAYDQDGNQYQISAAEDAAMEAAKHNAAFHQESINYSQFAGMSLSAIASRYGSATADRVQEYYAAHPTAEARAINQQYGYQQNAVINSGGADFGYQGAPAQTNPFDPDTAAGIAWEVARTGGATDFQMNLIAEQEVRAAGMDPGFIRYASDIYQERPSFEGEILTTKTGQRFENKPWSGVPIRMNLTRAEMEAGGGITKENFGKFHQYDDETHLLNRVTGPGVPIGIDSGVHKARGDFGGPILQNGAYGGWKPNRGPLDGTAKTFNPAVGVMGLGGAALINSNVGLKTAQQNQPALKAPFTSKNLVQTKSNDWYLLGPDLGPQVSERVGAVRGFMRSVGQIGPVNVVDLFGSPEAKGAVGGPQGEYQFGEYSKWSEGAGETLQGLTGYDAAEMEEYAARPGTGPVETFVASAGATVLKDPGQLPTAAGQGLILAPVFEGVGIASSMAGAGIGGKFSAQAGVTAAKVAERGVPTAIFGGAVAYGVTGGLTDFSSKGIATRSGEMTPSTIAMVTPIVAGPKVSEAKTWWDINRAAKTTDEKAMVSSLREIQSLTHGVDTGIRNPAKFEEIKYVGPEGARTLKTELQKEPGIVFGGTTMQTQMKAAPRSTADVDFMVYRTQEGAEILAKDWAGKMGEPFAAEGALVTRKIPGQEQTPHAVDIHSFTERTGGTYSTPFQLDLPVSKVVRIQKISYEPLYLQETRKVTAAIGERTESGWQFFPESQAHRKVKDIGDVGSVGRAFIEPLQNQRDTFAFIRGGKASRLEKAIRDYENNPLVRDYVTEYRKTYGTTSEPFSARETTAPVLTSKYYRTMGPSIPFVASRYTNQQSKSPSPSKLNSGPSYPSSIRGSTPSYPSSPAAPSASRYPSSFGGYPSSRSTSSRPLYPSYPSSPSLRSGPSSPTYPSSRSPSPSPSTPYPLKASPPSSPSPFTSPPPTPSTPSYPKPSPPSPVPPSSPSPSTPSYPSYAPPSMPPLGIPPLGGGGSSGRGALGITTWRRNNLVADMPYLSQGMREIGLGWGAGSGTFSMSRPRKKGKHHKKK